MNHNGLLQWIYAHILDEQMNSDPRSLFKPFCKEGLRTVIE